MGSDFYSYDQESQCKTSCTTIYKLGVKWRFEKNGRWMKLRKTKMVSTLEIVSQYSLMMTIWSKKFFKFWHTQPLDAASNLPLSKLASHDHDLQKRSHSQQLRSFTSCPPEMLALIFSHVPVKDRLNCSRVCTSWHRVLKDRSSCWRDVVLGRNAICYDADPSLHAADWLLLEHVEEIKLRPSNPIETKEDYLKFEYHDNVEPEDVAGDAIEYLITEIPLKRLHLFLITGKRLRKFDLSDFWVAEGNSDAFRYIQVSSSYVSRRTHHSS